MGNCCENENYNDSEEIMNSNSIDEIKNHLIEKTKMADLEIEEINIYLKNRHKKPSRINIDGFKKEDIKKRIPYLGEMKNCLSITYKLLEQNPHLDLVETKKRIKDFYILYICLYDDKKRYETWMINFKSFVDNYEINKTRNSFSKNEEIILDKIEVDLKSENNSN